MIKFTLSAAVALAVLLSFAGAEPTPKLEGWTYRSDNRFFTPEWADKTGKALRDGDLTRAGSVIYAGGTIVLDIDLGRLARISSVVAHVSRPNDNYKLRTFRVQAKVLGHYEEVGSVEGFWGHTQQRDFRLEVKTPNTVTDALRLVFETPSILYLSEVEIYGTPASAAGKSSGITLAPVKAAKPSAREVDVDRDGKPEVVLENSLVRLIFWPSRGGVCRSFLYKPANAELVAPWDSHYGLFRDQLWSPNYSFGARPYTWRTGGDAKSAWVELTTSGVGGMLGFTTLTKRITLSEGSPVVRAHYRLLNDPSSQTEYTYGLWFHHFTGVPGRVNCYFDPTEEGVKEYRFDPKRPAAAGEVWHKNPARGWTAVCDANGVGLVMTMDERYLYCFYHWAGVGVPVATHEWRFNRIPLKSGQALETDIVLMPFQGLNRVDGVVEDVIGAIEWQPAEGEPRSAIVRLQLASPLSKPANATVRVRPLPTGTWKTLGTLALLPGRAATQSVPLASLAPGAYVLQCQVSRAGKVLGEIERPFSLGGARLVYRLAPRAKRIGLGPEEAVSLPRHDLSDAVVTPHIPWARPLPGGPIQAVVLCDDHMAREIVELKQRLDLDVTYVKFRTYYWDEELYCGDRSISTPDQANRRLLEYLQSNRYDLFILAGFHWNAHFTPEVREAITRQVREGAGLVFIEPDGFKPEDPLAPMMGIAKGRNMFQWATWQPVPSSPLVAGLPWHLFPKTRYMDYERWPEGEVHANLSIGKPLLVTNTFGRGRTAALTYDVLTHEMSYRGYAGLTPILSYRGGWLREEFSQMAGRYWESWYAWLARIAVWAAGRNTGVRLTALEPISRFDYGSQATLSLALEGGKETYRVSADFEDRWGQPVGRVEATYTPGQGTVRLPVPTYLPSGTNRVSVVVRDAAGASVAWGQTSVQGTSPVVIQAVQPEKEIVPSEPLLGNGQPYDVAFRSREPFRIQVALNSQEGSVETYPVRARLYDTHRRLLFEETRPAARTEMRFEARPSELRAMGLEWEVEVLDPAGRRVDTQRAKVICPRPRNWDRFRLTSWNGLYLWRSEYLYPYLAPLVEDLVDVHLAGGTELNTGHVWRHYWHNIEWSYLGLLDYIAGGVPNFRDQRFAEKVANYNETKSKEWLIRTPCLSDPDWRGKVMAHLRECATRAQAFGGAFDYCMGDEMSLTYYTRYFDFCWSPHCLAGFRTWLQQRYGTLEALNRAWETNFARWDAVVPMTLDEVKGRANAAPWCEFRDYMNDVVANFYAEVQQTLRSVDPQAKAGLSGTQEPRAGNGMDWWKNSRAFSYYHSYNTGWSNEMRRSFAAETGVLQSPYYAGYWQSGRTIEYNVFWCLLHDTSGISAWTTPIFFYNDFTYSESGRDTLALCHEMKRGLWDLVRTGRRLHDGIAIHYSHDSINASQLLGKEEEIVRVRDAWVKLIEDLGLQYDFLATPQIEAGALTKPKPGQDPYRVLLLPESFAISDAEKAEIEAFVQGGGTVIADMNVGVLDGKCRRGTQGMLDSLFGIRRLSAADGTVGLTARLEGVPPVELKLPPAEVLTATTAQVFGQGSGEGKPPAFLRNRVGQGSAWYLNVDLSQFDGERTFHSPTEKAMRAALERILSGAGVKPSVRIALASGRTPHIEVVRYQAGDLTFVGLLHSRGEGEELATLTLPVDAYVYDCRTGEPLGKRREVRATFAGGQARIYCLSPQPLAVPKLSLVTPTIAVGEEVRYAVSLPNGTDQRRQMVRLTVMGPDGRERREYARNILLGAQGFEGAFRLALNDPRGSYRLVVRDVASGATAQASLTVQ